MIFLYAFLSVLTVSLLSLLGAVFLVLKRHTFKALITYTLSLSSGILLGAVFFDLIPESYAKIGDAAYISVITGIISFFALEKFIHWHHEVGEYQTEKPVAYLSLVGDSVHNFLDGTIIAVAFLTSVPLGITTTLAVIAHEIPHELGDFFILIYGGLSNSKALWFNFLSALTAIAGTLVVFVFSAPVVHLAPYLVGFAAGNFLYIASSDLIPELHKKHGPVTSIAETVCIIIGVLLMRILTMLVVG
ncbi:ZIP family metal transporter [Candidatus Gottesmanbacteria bacterium]|nr:ZIP family metal transporter [Candidatus Gottesmanbacteria bacterium]